MDFVFEEFDHALDNKILHALLVLELGGVYDAFEDVVFGVLLDLLDADVSLLHSEESSGVYLCRFLNVQIHIQLTDLLVVVLIQVRHSFLNDLVFFLLENPLPDDLDLECLLMGLLPHHSLELKRICFEGHFYI